MKEEYYGKFDEDDAEFLIESEMAAWAMHDTATYIDLGTADAGSGGGVCQIMCRLPQLEVRAHPRRPRTVEGPLVGNLGRRTLPNHSARRGSGNVPDEAVMRVEQAPGGI